MIEALGTLAFLATLWLLVVVGATVLEESGAKIAAALKGQPRPQRVAGLRTIRIRMPQPVPARSARPQWRAAA